MATVRISVSLNAVQDADILERLEREQQRGRGSQVVREALRLFFEQDVSRRQIMVKLDSLEQQIASLSVVEARPETPGRVSEDEDEDLSNNLDKSLQMFEL
ncbi:hypothetical protein GF380_02415 [Candidatus Uhrbacteria bacterium]|nr:hypothetical protein [Candidatus Uhrbacteria bacterium]